MWIFLFCLKYTVSGHTEMYSISIHKNLKNTIFNNQNKKKKTLKIRRGTGQFWYSDGALCGATNWSSQKC